MCAGKLSRLLAPVVWVDGGAAHKSESSGARRVGVMMWACETGGQGGLGVSTWAGALAGQRHESSGMSTEDRAWRAPRRLESYKGQAQEVHMDGIIGGRGSGRRRRKI